MPASTSAADRPVVLTPDADEPSLAALAGQAIEEGRALVQAEIALVKAKIGERVGAYRSAIVFFAIAGVLVLAALVALLVGLILSLATLIGPGWATAAVVVAVLTVAGVLALIGKSRLAPPDLAKAP
jgi:hypothetical protein